ncbi:unnamed protein product [Ilex paraguariensis]|uniref:Uncharacterized protein n=1 Tax=Ilex paraguariensis TaxID=185542 RepID=A0ABC8RET2_9AQUA
MERLCERIVIYWMLLVLSCFIRMFLTVSGVKLFCLCVILLTVCPLRSYMGPLPTLCCFLSLHCFLFLPKCLGVCVMFTILVQILVNLIHMLPSASFLVILAPKKVVITIVLLFANTLPVLMSPSRSLPLFLYNTSSSYSCP